MPGPVDSSLFPERLSSEHRRRNALLVCGLCLLVLFVRWPEILLDAQFWGEDGWNWWPEARALGWRSLILPHTGYFQTDDRVIALLARPFPLTWAPTLYALAAVVFELLPPAYFVSRRCAELCPSFPLRAVIALSWCALPNSWEVHGNLTNSQWHLALLSFLILASRDPRSVGQWMFDVVFLLLGATSGPFCLMLTPIAALILWQRRSPASATRLAIVAAGALVQGSAIYMAQRGIPPNLGATPTNFARLIAGQIALATMFGHTSLPHWYNLTLWRVAVMPWVLFLVVVWLSMEAMRRWPALRLAGLFTLLMLAASLSRPLGTADGSAVWVSMRLPDSGMRYLFLPLVFWMTVLVSLTFAAPRGWARRVASGMFLCTLLVGIPRDWRFPHEADRDFYGIARRFEQTPPGQTFEVPVRPGSHTFYTR